MKIELDGRQVFVGQGGIVADPGVCAWRGGDTPRLVLLHGAGMDRTVWVLLARYFARHGIDVVVPDLPGHGGSAGPVESHIDAMADWTCALLDTLQREHGLGSGPLAIGGHSMGSFVALESARRLAGSGTPPATLLLFGSGFPMTVGPSLLEAARLDSPVAADIITTFGHAYASRLGHNTVPGISVQNVARALLRRAAPGVLHDDLAACHAYGGASSLDGALDAVDVHLIAGDEDRMTPMPGSRALADLTGATLHVIDGAGHMMMAEQPERVLQSMRSVLPRG